MTSHQVSESLVKPDLLPFYHFHVKSNASKAIFTLVFSLSWRVITADEDDHVFRLHLAPLKTP